MKILLVNPPRFEGIPVIREERCEVTERYSILEPYSLLQIGALLRKKVIEVELIDANGFDLSYEQVEEEMRKFNYDVLIFRFTPTTFDHDLKICQISKKINPSAKTIGICFTLGSLAKEVMKEAKEMDIYVRHEYEAVVPNLVENLNNLKKVGGIAYREKGEIKVNDDSAPIENYDSLPIPAYDLLPSLKPYFINTPYGSPFTIMYTSKGCPFQCIYCTVAGTKAKMRSAKSVIEEIKFLKQKYNIKTISFFDETFTIDKKRVLELCKGIQHLRITWYCNTRANLIDLELLKIMRKAGCKGMSFGIESGSDKILKNIRKGITSEQQSEGIKMAKKAGIKIFCSFIFGLPGENKETIEETINFVRKTLPTSAQFNIAVPYPGTKLYDIAVKNNWIKKIDWRSLYQDESLMRNDDLTPKELDEARKRAYKELYSNPQWIMQNVVHVIRNPEDFILAFRYSIKIMNNYFIHGMKHAH